MMPHPPDSCKLPFQMDVPRDRSLPGLGARRASVEQLARVLRKLLIETEGSMVESNLEPS